MKRTILTVMTAGTLVLGIAGVVNSAEDSNYGRSLMTEQERAEHRERMRNMETEQQRNEYRKQVHEQMNRRGEERGIAVPDEPGQRGKGRSDPGSGYGSGRGGGGRDR